MTISARYWRYNITLSGSGSLVRCTALELRATVGGANQATTGTGTATASSTNGANVAGNAFDSNIGTDWLSNAVVPQWLQWDAGAPIAVDQVVITQPLVSTPTQSAINGSIQYSSDGVSWINWNTFTGAAVTPSNVQVTLLYQEPGVITFDGMLPLLTMNAYMGASLNSALPALTLDAYFGAALDAALPALSLQAWMGVNADMALPALLLDAAAHDATGENSMEGAIPMLRIEADFGAQLAGKIPMLQLDAAMTGVALITVDLTLPMMTLDAGGIGSPYIITVDLALPMLDLSAADFAASLEASLPMMTLSATMAPGGLLTADLVLPMMTLDAQGTQQSHAWLDLSLPMLMPVAFATADLWIPMLVLDGQITAVVAITYEGYAVNLKSNPDLPVNQVTRYKNFPFTQILRFGSRYVAVGVDGLYILGGDTDAGAPIDWALTTGATDFKAREKKHVHSLYVGGRLGPAMAVTIRAGEKAAGEVEYSYANTLGAEAQNYRQKFGKALKARYIGFGLADETGGAFELDTLDPEVDILQRS